MRKAASKLLSCMCIPFMALYFYGGYTEGRVRYELYVVHSQAIKMGLAELYYVGPGEVKWRWNVKAEEFSADEDE